jgi:hypothetical protein
VDNAAAAMLAPEAMLDKAAPQGKPAGTTRARPGRST